VHLAVFRVSGGVTEIEVVEYNGVGVWQEHIISAGSTISPSNCTEPNLISVGAVGWNNFGSPFGTANIIMPYSNRGPTNSGYTRPHLCGPTDTNTLTYNGPFTGTSCATPNAAGTAAAFWSSAPILSANGIRHLLENKAELLKDWGDYSFDNIYGHGGIALHPFFMNTVWVDQTALNFTGSNDMPYFTVAQAQNGVFPPGRVVFLGGNYPEVITLNQGSVRYESVVMHAIIGSSSGTALAHNPQDKEDANTPELASKTGLPPPLLKEADKALMEALPTEFSLSQNYPNPFNPTTTIKYALKERVQVNLKIYDLLGQHVRTLVDDSQNAGFKEVVWDGKNDSGQAVASGVYLYRMVASSPTGDSGQRFVQVRKLSYMK
jgi:hypothetical protein